MVSVACYIAAQYVALAVISVLFSVGLRWQIESVNSLLAIRLAIYSITMALLASAMWYRYRRFSLGDIALRYLPRWKDIGYSILGILVYGALTITVLSVVAGLVDLDLKQAQDIGFSRLYGGDLLAAFLVLVVLTPFIEEVLFRGFLYSRLRLTALPWWVPALVVSLLFGVAHGQWNVGIDTFCLSMVACALREVTGSIWGGIILHTAKNMLAFMLTFVFISGAAG